jgi:hypothetical protein
MPHNILADEFPESYGNSLTHKEMSLKRPKILLLRNEEAKAVGRPEIVTPTTIIKNIRTCLSGLYPNSTSQGTSSQTKRRFKW